jgi:predicted metal-dependent phosphoesterase TrpH
MIKTMNTEFNAKNVDLHLHTIVSDGEITPDDILSCAKELQVEKISITDHDAVGAYTHFGNDLFQRAEAVGISLIPGIELDSYYSDVEIHILGYGIDLDDKDLNEHLSQIHSLRRLKTNEQIDKINEIYGKEIIKKDEIFIPKRDTLMKPHLVHSLLKQGLFPEYREAARWVSENAKSSVSVPKPYTEDIIKMVKNAGGHAFLAHAGFYILESGLDIDKMLNELLPFGLDGLETEYPYYKTSPKFQTREAESAIITFLTDTARKYNLKTSRGSDAHRLEQMREFNG